MITKKNVRNNKAQMPLALAAVVLLVAGSLFCVVYADIERGESNTDNLEYELKSVDNTIDNIEFDIETELGTILTKISTEGKGNLTERAKTFNSAVDSFFSSNYPKYASGVTTEILSKDISLGLKTLSADGSDVLFTGSGIASYLQASGTVSVRISSSGTITERDIDVNANATSGLPLAIDSATSFELSVGGDVSMLSQMMEYQLSSLAQSRVLQGYGMKSESGDYGTKNILTVQDVRNAFRNGVSVLQTMFFRSNAEGTLTNACKVDLASLLVIENGNIRIDVGALYSMAILSQVDDLAIKWLEYLGMDVFLDLLDSLVDVVTDVARKIWNGLSSLLTGENQDVKSIGEYIRNAMNNAGREDYEYDTFLNGNSITIEVDDLFIEYGVDDDVEIFECPGFDVDIWFPEVKITEWGGWNGFYGEYDRGRNQFKESLKSIIVDIANNVASGGVYEYTVDPYSDNTFMEQIEACIDDALAKGRSGCESVATSIIDCSEITDPMMIGIYEKIVNSKYDVYKVDEYRDSVYKSIMSKVVETASVQGVFGFLEIFSIIDPIASAIADEAAEDYKKQIDLRVEEISFIEECVVENRSSIVSVLGVSVVGLMNLMNLESFAKPALELMVQEMISYMDVNPSAGIQELPGTDGFALTDGNGAYFREILTVSDKIDCNVDIIDPRNSSRNVHDNGILTKKGASYVSVFEVHVTGVIDYTVTGTNPVFKALGMYDSSYTGSVEVDTVLTVPVVSAWGLAGVDYVKTDSLLNDLKEFVLAFLDVLLEPVKRGMAVIQDLIRIITPSLVEYSAKLGEMVQKVFSVISIPLELFHGFLDSIMESVGNLIIKIGIKTQTFSFDFFGMTLTLGFNLASLKKNEKDIVKISLETVIGSVGVKASIHLKESSKKGKYIIFNGSAEGKDWSIDVTADPQRKTTDKFITVSGSVRGVGFYGTVPELVQYRQVGISTSDIPAVSTALENLPSLIPGTKTQIEMGVNLKYNAPMKPGLLINEMEQNPVGDDAGSEWVELFNNTTEPVNLGGYTLVPASGEHKSQEIEDIVLAPGAKVVIVFEKQALNNTASKAGKGERLSLVDADGNVIDQTPWCVDGDNSDYTWQRTFDGCTGWSFMKGTPGTTNGGKVPGGAIVKELVFDILKNAAIDVFDEMGKSIASVEGLCEYIERVISKVIESIITTIAECLVEALVYLDVRIADVSGALGGGVKISLGVDSGIISDGLRFLLSKLPIIGDYVSNPYGLTATDVIMDNVFLKVQVYGGFDAPSFLNIDSKVELGLLVRTNASAMAQLFGDYEGRWYVEAGIVAEDVPSYALPSFMEADKDMNSDLWLFKMMFYRV